MRNELYFHDSRVSNRKHFKKQLLKQFTWAKCSYKVFSPSGPNLWPQFRLGEICGEQGLPACGRAHNTQSPHVRPYLLLHLSIGTWPLHPQISPAWSHYTAVYPFFREEHDRSCSVLVLKEEIFQNFGSQPATSDMMHWFESLQVIHIWQPAL